MTQSRRPQAYSSVHVRHHCGYCPAGPPPSCALPIVLKRKHRSALTAADDPRINSSFTQSWEAEQGEA
ncbi:hypothetical protein RRG08_044763 [Elysia crispata]|uniref:Uncharacterized protein n=1 Tax=Elysia crispata TaxID=231223 RepID=A0AAE0ZHI9_9GAST|nr:hypothetical protein RRG08_044763 [Elysia crispata]